MQLGWRRCEGLRCSVSATLPTAFACCSCVNPHSPTRPSCPLPSLSSPGPVFSELDEQLQEGFRDYLAERGINEDLEEYLRCVWLFGGEGTEVRVVRDGGGGVTGGGWWWW